MNIDNKNCPCLPNAVLVSEQYALSLISCGMVGPPLTFNIIITEAGFGWRPGGGKRHTHARDRCDHGYQLEGGPVPDNNTHIVSNASQDYS